MAKRKSRPKSEAEVTAPASPKKASGGISWKLRAAGTAFLVLFIYYLNHKPSASGSGPATAASGPPAGWPEWGPELELEVVSKFDSPAPLVMDLKADAEGNVYVLTGGSLQLFKDGKLVKAVELGGGAPWHGMAFDGKSFYITDSSDGAILKVDKSLAPPTSFAIKGASRLLGIAYSSKTGDIYSAEVGGTEIFAFDPSGKKTRRISGPYTVKTTGGFVIDLAALADGEFMESDQPGGAMFRLGSDSKFHKLPKVPWSSPTYERAAYVGGLIYMNCFKDERVIIMNASGEAIGHIKKDSPQMIGAGMDGFLYLHSGNKILKLKPHVPKAAAK